MQQQNVGRMKLYMRQLLGSLRDEMRTIYEQKNMWEWIVGSLSSEECKYVYDSLSYLDPRSEITEQPICPVGSDEEWLDTLVTQHSSFGVVYGVIEERVKQLSKYM